MSLLAEPAVDSPLNVDAGNILRNDDLIAYKSIARLYCNEFWSK